MDTFNIGELFKFNTILCISTINFNILKTQKITIPKLKTFEYNKVDIYYLDLYSKMPHHSHR
mgnify:CR=1 FL=1